MSVELFAHPFRDKDGQRTFEVSETSKVSIYPQTFEVSETWKVSVRGQRKGPAFVLLPALLLAILLAACSGQATNTPAALVSPTTVAAGAIAPGPTTQAQPAPASPSPAPPVSPAPAAPSATTAATATAATGSTAPTAATEAGPTATATLAPGTYRNPVLDADVPDPDVLKVGDTYYVFASNAGMAHVQVAQSKDLVHWEMLPDALPVLPSWAAADFGWTWAPDASPSPSGSGYVLYYTTRFAEGFGGRQCIGTATSDKPAGPYKPAGDKPIVCQLDQGGSIDPDDFTEEAPAGVSTRYLLWKNDGNCCGGQTWIYIQKLSADGLALEGQPTQLLTTDQTWEGALIEGPVLIKHGGKYYLFYSANDFNTPRYAVGYAVADKLLGPYTKAPGPWLATTLPAGVVGPGGEDFTTGPDGKMYVLYHAWTPGAYRALDLNELAWQGDTPVIRGLSREPQPAPIR